MKTLFTAIAFFFLLSFSYGQHDKDAQWQRTHAGIHKVTCEEILHTTSYTYLLVNENGKTQWLAMPKMEDAQVGETYYYQGGNEMRDFKSAELGRTFESVMFLGGVVKAESMGQKQASADKTQVNPDEKSQIDLEPVEGGVTIEELFANKNDFSGKTVKIKGKVVKVSSSIMGRNWIHLQDGTEHEGKFDLVVTSQENVNVGDIVVLEGTVSIDKDFGYGYFYDLLIEDARVVE